MGKHLAALREAVLGVQSAGAFVKAYKAEIALITVERSIIRLSEVVTELSEEIERMKREGLK